MRAIYYLLMSMCFFPYGQTAQANVISNHYSTNLLIEYQNQTKPSAEPKSSYQKYAAVNFITKRNNISTDITTGDDLANNPIKETSCPSGQEKVNGICTDVSACKSSFPLSSADSTVGTFVKKDCGSKGIGYCYTGCQTGWVHSGCQCTAEDCSNFPLSDTNKQNCNGITSCKTGNTYKYKCTGCATGYKLLSSGVCTESACSEYGAGYYGTQTEHCKTSDVKRNGELHCYKCTACEDGWELSSSTGLCSEVKCSYTTAQISNCIKYQSITRSGTNFCYRCETCADGYTKNSTGTACSAKTCTSGYSSSVSNFNCSSVAVYKAGTGFCYKCQ